MHLRFGAYNNVFIYMTLFDVYWHLLGSYNLYVFCIRWHCHVPDCGAYDNVFIDITLFNIFSGARGPLQEVSTK